MDDGLIRCDQCWYAHPCELDEEMAECRFNPPVATGGLHCERFTHWPRVKPNDFCGKFTNTQPVRLQHMRWQRKGSHKSRREDRQSRRI